jgi:TRAP-type C4-dicarboxylate transport system substrate-binding protein
MSARAWQSLSPQDRAIFRAAARESSLFMREQWKAWEERSRDQAQKAGNVIISDFDRKPFEAATAGIYGEALSDPKLRLLAERIRQVQ